MPTIDDFVEQYRLALDAYASAESERFKLEELRKIEYAELFNHMEGAAETRKNQAIAHELYREATADLITATTEANTAKAKAKWMEVRWETWRTRNANRRAEINMR